MEIKQQYVQKYLHDIAIDQLVADYRARGYEVSTEEKIGNKYYPDLIARLGDEVIVIEVKTGQLTPARREQLAGIGDYVKAHRNYKLLVVLANPPKPKKIDIPTLNQLLSAHLINHFPDSLSKLSPHTRITDVTNVAVDEVTVEEDGSTLVKGTAVVNVSLSYDAPDQLTQFTEVFPLTFDVTLNHAQNKELTLTQVRSIKIDTSDFDD